MNEQYLDMDEGFVIARNPIGMFFLGKDLM